MPAPFDRNRLLQFVKRSDRHWLERHLQPVELGHREQLFAGQRATHAYFPTSCVVSLLRLLRNGDSAEALSIGNEGVVGYGALIDGRQLVSHAVVQVPGEALAVEMDVIQPWAFEQDSFRTVLMHYGRTILAQLMQNVICNQFHSARQRYARTLLQLEDRADRNSFPLTQEALAHVLGVRRATVGDIAVELQRERVIAYHRGMLTVLDRARLSELSCECYQTVSAEYDHFMNELRHSP